MYVTHRLEDAFAVGRRLAIMRDGEVKQVGPIDEVFRYPANADVAQIMGIANVFRAQVVAAEAGGLTLDWDGMSLTAPPQEVEPGSTVTAYIRPEDVKVLYVDRPLSETVRHNVVTGRIIESYLRPGARRLKVLLPNGHQIEVSHPPYSYTPLSLEAGEPVRLALRREALILLLGNS